VRPCSGVSIMPHDYISLEDGLRDLPTLRKALGPKWIDRERRRSAVDSDFLLTRFLTTHELRNLVESLDQTLDALSGGQRRTRLEHTPSLKPGRVSPPASSLPADVVHLFDARRFGQSGVRWPSARSRAAVTFVVDSARSHSSTFLHGQHSTTAPL
jgi:hypothetical protein